MKKPDAVLVASAGFVGATTALLPFVTGYGTVLFQTVVLSAWGLVAWGLSSEYADRHHLPVWLVALGLNLLLFLIPGVAIWLIARRRWPRLCVGLVLSWLVFYLALLLVLFPATDGP